MSSKASATSYPTRPKDLPLAVWERGAWGRRAAMLVLAGVVIAGALGFLGFKAGTVTDSGGGYTLTITYPDVSRAGISSPWEALVESPDGFDGPITLATSREFFTLFDLNGIFPDPASATYEEDMVLWEFDPPDGTVLRVHFDARVEPAVHRGERVSTQLIVDNAVVADVTYEITLMP
jgi:hypothetical protein